MKLPAEVKPALWGIVGGAVAAIVIGFTWGGWVTGGTSETRAVDRAEAAVVAARTLICVDNFRHSPDAEANLASLTKIDNYIITATPSSRRAAGRPCRAAKNLIGRWREPAPKYWFAELLREAAIADRDGGRRSWGKLRDGGKLAHPLVLLAYSHPLTATTLAARCAVNTDSLGLGRDPTALFAGHDRSISGKCARNRGAGGPTNGGHRR